MSEVIYFLHNPAAAAIKIGFSQRAMKRIRTHRFNHLEPLYLIGITAGNRVNERAIHSMLMEHRLRGEWFKTAPEVVQLANDVCEHGVGAIGLKFVAGHPQASVQPVEAEDLPDLVAGQPVNPAPWMSSMECVNDMIERLGRIRDLMERRAIYERGYV
jgi:hypothetical protein